MHLEKPDEQSQNELFLISTVSAIGFRKCYMLSLSVLGQRNCSEEFIIIQYLLDLC